MDWKKQFEVAGLGGAKSSRIIVHQTAKSRRIIVHQTNLYI